MHGNSLEAYLVALVVPDADFAKNFCTERNLENVPLEEVCKMKEFEEFLMSNM